MIEPLMPEKRGIMQKAMGMLQGVGGAAQNIGSLSKLFGGGGGGIVGGGAATGGTAAGATTGAATTGGSSAGLSAYAPYAAPVVAGAAEYAAMRNPSLRGKMVGNRDVSMTGQKLGSGLSGMTKGLSLTGEAPDQMSAIERRYNTRQTAMADIEAARQALNQAGLSTQDRRSISQKLEQARIAAGGPKRGATGIA